MVVSGGAYKTNPLTISNVANVVVELRDGASLESAYGPDKYPKADGGYKPFFLFQNCTGCGISGNGMIWGKGGRPDSGGFDWWYQFDQGKIDDRPQLVRVIGGGNFKMIGITLLDSPAFNIYLAGVAWR